VEFKFKFDLFGGHKFAHTYSEFVSCVGCACSSRIAYGTFNRQAIGRPGCAEKSTRKQEERFSVVKEVWRTAHVVQPPGLSDVPKSAS
jgi:hypothetical protein